MNIYRVENKSLYIFVDHIQSIFVSTANSLVITYNNGERQNLRDNEAKAFLEYLDRMGVYTGWA
jgi:hypothetical protein